MFLVSKLRSQSQGPSSNRYMDKGKSFPPSDSDTAGEHLESGFFDTDKNQNAGLRSRFAEYARERRNSLVDWKYAQSRSTCAKILSAILGLLVILYAKSLIIPLLAAYRQ